MKRNGEQSLREQIHKWVVDRGTGNWHIARFGRTRFTRSRYVYVACPGIGTPLGMFFFRHNDGSWRVYPPLSSLPSFSYSKASVE